MTQTNISLDELDLIQLPRLRLDEGEYDLPGPEPVHTNLVQSSVELGIDVAIITPTLHTGCLDYHALAALFQDMSSLTPSFIISPDTSIRDRYEQLKNGMKYSTVKWPLATVKADKMLSYRTTHVRSADAPPGVIFTRYSTRLPNDEISRDIRAVLYDDAVKFEDDRWERFQDWRNRNEVPGVIYFIRDPLGPVYQRIKNDIDVVCAWTPYGIQSVINENGKELDDHENTVPDCTRRERELLNQKAEGQTHQIHACTEGPVVEAFADLWEAFEELEAAAEEIDEKDLFVAVGVAKRAVNGFTRLLANLEYSDNYRSEHGKATTLSGRIAQVKHIMEGLSGDAAAGRTPVEHVHHALCELRDTLTETNSPNWKRGAILTAMQKVTDKNEDLIIVLPDEPSREALQADLRINRTGFYSESRQHIRLHTPRSLPNAEPADHLLLYGPPKYKHRWLLRTPHAPYVGILAYEHELGLLHSQVRELNQEFQQSTPRLDENDVQTRLLSAISAPELYPDDVGSNALQPSDPTNSGVYDGISIDIPNADDIGSDSGTAFDDYELIDPDQEDSIEELIDGVTTEFSSGNATYSPNDGRSRSRKGSEGTKRTSNVEECVEIQVNDNKSITLESSDTIEVVDPDAGTTVKKPVSSVRPGEQVVTVEDRDGIRSAIEKLLLDSGYIDLVAYARLWKNQLQTEIERRDDNLDGFIQRVEQEGLDKRRSTYRSWYYGNVHLPKAKESLHALVRAYEMEEVLEEFENVWSANQKIRNIKRGFIDLLKKESQEALSTNDDGDPVIDEELDIRLSDLDPTDNTGNPFVQAHIVTDIQEVGTVSRSQVGRWRNVE